MLLNKVDEFPEPKINACQKAFVAYALYQFASQYTHFWKAPTTLDKINWFWLSSNSSPEAIQLLCENPDKIDWQNLNLSSLEALMLLLEHPEKIEIVDKKSLFENHHIFDDGEVIK